MELYALNEAFYTSQMLTPMSAGQIALWHALVRMANKSHWPDWFTIAGITLVQLSGLSPSGVKKARNELKQRGLIDFRANGTKATSYRIIDISESSRNGSQNISRNGSQNSSRKGSQNSSRKGSALIKQKQNETEQDYPHTPLQGGTPCGAGGTGSEIGGDGGYVAANLRGLSPGNWDELRSFLEDGITMELVRHAVDEAAAHGTRTWAYVRRILNRYIVQGITTTEQAKGTEMAPSAQGGLNPWLEAER